MFLWATHCRFCNGQEIPYLSWKPKFLYCVHCTLPWAAWKRFTTSQLVQMLRIIIPFTPRFAKRASLFTYFYLQSYFMMQYRVVSFGKWTDHCYTIKMPAASYSQIVVSIQQTTRTYFPEWHVSILRRQRNLKSHHSSLYPSFPPRAICASSITNSLTWRS
jgi:hypothetical protein